MVLVLLAAPIQYEFHFRGSRRYFWIMGESYKGWKNNLKSGERNISTWFFSSFESKFAVCSEVLACWECEEVVAVTFSEQASIIESLNLISSLSRQNLKDWKINKTWLIKLAMSTKKTFRHCICYLYESWTAKCTYSCRKCTKAVVLKVIQPEAAISSGPLSNNSFLQWINYLAKYASILIGAVLCASVPAHSVENLLETSPEAIQDSYAYKIYMLQQC